MFPPLKKAAPAEAAAARLLEAVRAAARQPSLFGEGRIPDSIDGRFESMVVHVVLLMDRLMGAGPEGAELNQALFDALFADLEAAVREMGAFDLSVAKRIRRMAEAFYGRLHAYREAFGAGDAAVRAALQRNLFATQSASPEFLAAMSAYVRASRDGLARQNAEALLDGQPPAWSSPPS